MYYRHLKNAGVLLVDNTLVQQTPTSMSYKLPFTQMAAEKIGNPLTLNTIVLGAVTHLLPFAEPRLMRKALEENLPAKIRPINVKAFNLGLREAKKHLGEPPAIWSEAANGAAEEEERPLE